MDLNPHLLAVEQLEGVFAQGHCDLLAAGMEATTFWKQMLLLLGQILADANGFRTEL